MKSILVGLLIANLIQWYPGYTQIDASTFRGPSPDSAYCLSISKARLLIRDALRVRLADSLLQTQSARIVLLSDEKQSLISSYTNLLNLSEQKFQKQKEITADMVRFSETWQSEAEYYQKRSKKFRRQRNGLGLGIIAVVVLALI